MELLHFSSQVGLTISLDTEGTEKNDSGRKATVYESEFWLVSRSTGRLIPENLASLASEYY